MAESVTRFVITHIGTRGMRRLTDPKQGRYTYATREEAEGRMNAILSNVTNDIAGVFGEQAVGSFQVRPVSCYPKHFDPMTCYFD
jgi:hypothetical protein